MTRFSACVLALLHFCHSSDSYGPQTLPDVGDAEFIKECVQTHNRFRSGVNPSASNMLYMSWDPDLAKTAKAWAKKCLFEHNTYLKEPGQAHPKFSPVGENLWTGSLSIFTVQGAISSWYNEVSAYTYDTNKCRGVCGHYTQIVWATSYKVGCAVHFCPRVAYSSITNAAHFICNYGPAGNYPVRPYKTGAACSDCNGEQCINQLCHEKLKLLERLERNLVHSQGDKKAENSSQESTDEDTQDSDGEDLGRQKTEGQLLGGVPAEVVPYTDSEITRGEDSIADAYDENTRLHQWTVRWMGIRKDDEFFHFVILCFAIGALLICYYYYKDWTISVGTGLVTFASLETTGIYFGLVYRIRSVLNSFVPLIDRFRLTGNGDLLMTACIALGSFWVLHFSKVLR